MANSVKGMDIFVQVYQIVQYLHPTFILDTGGGDLLGRYWNYGHKKSLDLQDFLGVLGSA